MRWRCSAASPRTRSRSAARLIYLQKVRMVEIVMQQQGSSLSRPSKYLDKEAAVGALAGASRRAPRGFWQPTDAAAELRVRCRDVPSCGFNANGHKYIQKLQHTRSCRAAAAKAGKSPPKVLPRVLAYCGHPGGASRGRTERTSASAQTAAGEGCFQ